MLEGGDDEPTRAHIQKIILTQYDRLQADRSKLGAKALGVAATPGNHMSQPAPSKSKWGRWGHRGEECRRGKQKNKYDGCFICGSQERKTANCPKRWKGESRDESALLTRATTVAMDSRKPQNGML